MKALLLAAAIGLLANVGCQPPDVRRAIAVLQREDAIIKYEGSKVVELKFPKESEFKSIPNKPLSLEAAAAIAKLTTLERLDLSAKNLTDQQIDLLRPLVNLQVLDVSDSALTAASCDTIASFPKLTKLDIHNNPIGDAGVERLCKNGELTFLAIGKTRITNAVMPSVGRLKKLYYLAIGGNPAITDEGLEKLAPLELRVLKVNGTSIRGHVFDQLASKKTLDDLDVSWTKIDDVGAKAIGGYENLRLLTAYNTKLTDAGIRELHRLKQLFYLHLTGTGITDASVPILAGLPRLIFIGVTETDLGDEAFADLKKAHPNATIGLVSYGPEELFPDE